MKSILTPRDSALLRAVARFGVATSDDLRRLFFSDVRRDTAMDRLRKLFDAGFLAAHSRSFAEANLYSLGPSGIAWAESTGVVAANLPRGPFEHHSAVVRLWTKLAVGIHEHEGQRLVRFEPDWELRSRFAGLMGPIVPDAAIEIAHPEGRTCIALEVDLTTERLGAFERKLTLYDASRYFSNSQSIGLAVVLVGAGERRRRSIGDLVRRSWSGSSVVCPESEWPSVVLDRVIETPLEESPDGKGRSDRATSSVVAVAPEQGEGHSQ